MLLDYILGARVADLTTKSPSGEVVGRVSWGQVLEYDHEVRKFAYELVRTGMAATISEGLKAAIKDPEVRQLHLMDPMTLSSFAGMSRGGSKRQPSGLDDFQGQPHKVKKVEGGGGGRKGKGKGKGSKGKKKGGLWLKTSTGALICFAHNASSGCPGGCGMQHVCQRCLGTHGMAQCTNGQASRPDTGGSSASSSAAGAIAPAAAGH